MASGAAAQSSNFNIERYCTRFENRVCIIPTVGVALPLSMHAGCWLKRSESAARGGNVGLIAQADRISKSGVPLASHSRDSLWPPSSRRGTGDALPERPGGGALSSARHCSGRRMH